MSALAYSGKITIGGLCPLVVSASALLIADLQARVTGLLALQARLTVTPPTLALNITLVTQLLAQLQAALAIGLPGVDFQLTAVAALLVSLEAQLALLLQLQALFGAPGVYVYTWDGPANLLGPALGVELATQWRDGVPTALHANALVLGTVTPATWVAMRTFFGGA
jgi:hypothetical protein